MAHLRLEKEKHDVPKKREFLSGEEPGAKKGGTGRQNPAETKTAQPGTSPSPVLPDSLRHSCALS